MSAFGKRHEELRTLMTEALKTCVLLQIIPTRILMFFLVMKT